MVHGPAQLKGDSMLGQRYCDRHHILWFKWEELNYNYNDLTPKKEMNKVKEGTCHSPFKGEQ